VEILAPKCGTLCFVDIAYDVDGSFTGGVFCSVRRVTLYRAIAKYNTWRAAKTTYKHKYKIDMSKHTEQIYNKLYNYYYNTSIQSINNTTNCLSTIQ
jgi:hypothetical protein